MKLILILLITPSLSYSQQNTRIDSFALSIPDSLSQKPQTIAKTINQYCTTDYEKVRVLYTWITHNIRYEDSISKNDSLENLDLVMYSLATRSGICKNYSALFTSLCLLVGLESYSVLGYTMINKKFDPKKDHAWNIVKIDNDYFLFDPTWDAGAKKFNNETKEYEFKYFESNPIYFIKSHMPYDPVMQLMDYPITHKEFFKRKIKGKSLLDYKAEIHRYNKLNELDKLKITLLRAESNEIQIPQLEFLHKRLKYFVEKNLEKEK